MDDKNIERINVLYKKSKEEGLTPEEANEQKKLREDYIAAIRGNLRGQLDQVSVLNPDGSVTSLKEAGKKNQK